MKASSLLSLLSLSLLASGPALVGADSAPSNPNPNPAEISLRIDASKPGPKISPTLYGIFFEEINRAGDGGLYAEMIQNRSFEDSSLPIAWTLVKGEGSEATMQRDDKHPLNKNNPNCLRLEIQKTDGKPVGIANDGFKGGPYRKTADKPEVFQADWEKMVKESPSGGIAVQSGKQYDFSLYAQADEGFSGALKVSLQKQDGTELASQTIKKLGKQWQKFTGALVSKTTDTDARLVVSATSPGTVYLDMISLFPKETFKGRSNGLRADLAEMLLKMHPAFVRFPGGCFVEGSVMEDATRWKKTVGDIAERPGHWNLWGYYSNDGLGYHEYLQLCEDIGAEPLFVIQAGMAHKDHVPMEKMDEFVQDALDAIEYANGSPKSKWGALRAKAGHPKPFNMKYVEIGNENGGPLYNERYNLFHDAIKKRYPEIKLLACQWGGIPKERPLDIIDEHYYNTPEFFAQQAYRYDSYVRTGPKIYIGEFAVTRGPGAGKLISALGEAAFMTGMERNADIVAMGSYAPLLELIGWKRWSPNAIVFDSSRVFGIPSYHAQAMFASHRADEVLPVEFKSPQLTLDLAGSIGLGSWGDTVSEFKEIKVTQGEKVLFESDFSKALAGFKSEAGKSVIKEGALQITGIAASNKNGKPDAARVSVGSPDWKDYTLSLKARKISGTEGFLVAFASPDGRAKAWWNLGGWNNSSHGLEHPVVKSERVKGQIESGRWYDVKVEVKGPTVRCYLDGNLVHEASSQPFDSLFAVAGTKKDEIILKVVNFSGKAQASSIRLEGTGKLAPEAKAWVMASEDPLDANSFEQPEKVVPKQSEIKGIGAGFKHEFPGNSITIIRLQKKS